MGFNSKLVGLDLIKHINLFINFFFFCCWFNAIEEAGIRGKMLRINFICITFVCTCILITDSCGKIYEDCFPVFDKIDLVLNERPIKIWNLD